MIYVLPASKLARGSLPQDASINVVLATERDDDINVDIKCAHRKAKMKMNGEEKIYEESR